ncbi:MAG: hypothetical protein JSV22_04720 [Bacteroidales bacterium]|nr:MAG: hypothetical protein JSV22_04720 [Bacteroidales bacterium]
MQKHELLIFILVLISILTGCGDKEQDDINNANEIEEGSWLKYSPLDWTHDGNPVSGTHCKVYSDGAGQTLKLQCLEFADLMFEDILHQFSFDNFEDLILPPENDKINVYINTEHEDNVAYAYWGTIFITIRTTELDTNRYEYLFKHELTHEFEFLIEGYVNLGTDFWFREAIAIYCGGGFNFINTVDDLEDWIIANENYPGQGNPIMIHAWEDFPEGADITGYYCEVFDITMKYLLDPKGLNKSYNDVLNVFYEIREGNTFDNAFQNNFGLSLAVFEVEFYDRIRAYLLAL